MNTITPKTSGRKRTLEDEIKHSVQNEIEYNAYSGSIIKTITADM